MRGRKEKVDQGIVMGQGIALYDYRQEGKKKQTHLVLVPAEVKTIRLIFHLFVIKRMPVQHIVNRLNAMNVATPSKARNFWKMRDTWTTKHVYRILNAREYTGRFEMFRYVQVNGRKRLRPLKLVLFLSFQSCASLVMIHTRLPSNSYSNEQKY
jgi:Recombinase